LFGVSFNRWTHFLHHGSAMFQDLISQQFFEAMADCRRIYVDQSIDAAVLESNLSGAQRLEYLDDVEFRFTRLVIKVFVEVAWSDCVWSEGEGRIAVQMLEDHRVGRVDRSATDS